MSAFPNLFKPGRIGRITVPNRLVMPPMVLNYADARGMVTERYLAHMERVAAGGVGTMILEASFVAPEGRGFTNQIGIHDDGCIRGLSRVAETAHRHGALVGPQLYHAGRQTQSAITGSQPVAPSVIPCPLMQELPKELSKAEITALVNTFAAAAERARAAGFDFVEIHGAHGYLLTQFMSPFSNERSDEYGGSLENRLRFPLEVVAAVRRAVGADFPVFYRISAEEHVPGGLTLDETRAAAVRLEEAGIDALHVSVGNYGSYVQGRMIPPMSMPDAVNVDLAAAMKVAVSIPVIAVGKCRTPTVAEKIVADGKADFVAIGRPLLADPDWPRKAREGRAQDINLCIACNQGCISRLFDQQDAWCTVNPETGREQLYAEQRGRGGRKILVAGGGPAGMTAALTAARFGENVVLCEREAELGGQLEAASAAPHREGWGEFREHLVKALRSDEFSGNIEIRLNTEVTAKLVQSERPDLVVVATGSLPVVKPVPADRGTQVLSARDVLEGRAQAKGRVLIAGGGCSGAQTAEYLAARGHAVTLIESTGSIAGDMPVDERHLLLARLHELGVQLKTETRLLRITSEGVLVSGLNSDTEIPADTVLFCLGAQSEDALVDELTQAGWQTATVGDARRPRRVTDAVAEGALVVLYFAKEEQRSAAS